MKKVLEFNQYDSAYWNMLERIVLTNKIVIDRPKGTNHPKYNNMVYPLDYGYIEHTVSMDNNGIDIWVGSQTNKKINGILCVIDPIKNDSEIKILYGCSLKEIEIIYLFHNENVQKAIIIERK